MCTSERAEAEKDIGFWILNYCEIYVQSPDCPAEKLCSKKLYILDITHYIIFDDITCESKTCKLM